MLIVFLILNIVYIYISLKYYGKVVNPISIYSFIWSLTIFLFEIKLVEYFDLTIKTWGVIILFQLFYNFGCFLARDLIFKKSKNLYSINNIVYNEKLILKIILLLTIISSFAIVPNLLATFSKYGLNLINQTNILYADRLAGNNTVVVPYLTAFIEPALILIGFYISKYKFKFSLIIPLLLYIASSLISGARLSLVKGGAYIIIPFIMNSGLSNKIKLSIKQKISIGVVFVTLIILFITLTQNRSVHIETNPYMSEMMVKLTRINPAIYKIYIYITSSIGVLNEFLKGYEIEFGVNTLLPLYSILEKVGVEVVVQDYQEFYAVPITSNVGTYIRELVQDFGILLGMLVTTSTAFIYRYNFIKFQRNNKFINLFLVTVMTWGVLLSFFMWEIRLSNTWITIVVGIIVAIRIEKSNITTTDYLLENKKKIYKRRGKI